MQKEKKLKTLYPFPVLRARPHYAVACTSAKNIKQNQIKSESNMNTKIKQNP